MDALSPSAKHTPPPRLPADDPLRAELHQELHARPPARVTLPAASVFVAVLNAGISVEQELDHLRRLPGLEGLQMEALRHNFLRLPLGDSAFKWERHTEFTRYSIVQDLPGNAGLDAQAPSLLDALAPHGGWLASIPGRTIAAIEIGMVVAPPTAGTVQAREQRLRQAQTWFGGDGIVLSELSGPTWVVADFLLRPSGFERMLVIAPPDTSEDGAGRILQQLVEIETYRLMALRGLPVAKGLSPTLAQAEAQLATLTAQLEHTTVSEQSLLDQLVALAARVEHAIADHSYRFAATRAYAALVELRINDLREQVIPGTQTIGEFMRRRLSPAIATVAAAEQRLNSLSERISRTGALLRTRVDIAAEDQHQQLLARLTRGQALQLQLQTTVEGLSIAAISYYVISLLLYLGKGAKTIGMLPVDPETAVAAAIPLVLWGTWRTSRKIHERFGAHSSGPSMH